MKIVVMVLSAATTLLLSISSHAQGCVTCYTRTACGPGGSSALCNYDRETASCMNSGSCKNKFGFCDYSNPEVWCSDFGLSGPTFTEPKAMSAAPGAFISIEVPESLRSGFAVRADHLMLQDAASVAPRQVDAAITSIHIANKQSIAIQSGELVTSYAWKGDSALAQAIAQGRPLGAVEDDAGEMRFRRAIHWDGDAGFMLSVWLVSSSGEISPSGRNELQLTFRRGEFVSKAGKIIPQFQLTSWNVAEPIVQEDRFGRHPVVQPGGPAAR